MQVVPQGDVMKRLSAAFEWVLTAFPVGAGCEFTVDLDPKV